MDASVKMAEENPELQAALRELDRELEVSFPRLGFNHHRRGVFLVANLMVATGRGNHRERVC